MSNNLIVPLAMYGYGVQWCVFLATLW